MSLVDAYEVLIVGSGRAGQALAAGLGGVGHRVPMIERGMRRARAARNPGRIKLVPQRCRKPRRGLPQDGPSGMSPSRRLCVKSLRIFAECRAAIAGGYPIAYNPVLKQLSARS